MAEQLREMVDRRLSGVDWTAADTQAVLSRMRGETKVKYKLSTAALVAALVLLLASLAVAAGMGLFGSLQGDDMVGDSRLGELDAVSSQVEQRFDLENGLTLTLHQTWYDGERVFISYTLAGERAALEKGEGLPEGVNWAMEDKGLYTDDHGSDAPWWPELAAWLDGSGPHWAKVTSFSSHDGLFVQDGDSYDRDLYLDIYYGGDTTLEDGTLAGWKETHVPEELAGQEQLNLCMVLFGSTTTYYQDAEGYKWAAQRGDQVVIPFTVVKDTAVAAYSAAGQGAGWQAEGTLRRTPIDLSGTLYLTAPEAWLAAAADWELDPGDHIIDWQLWSGDAPVAAEGGLEGYGTSPDGTKLMYQLLYQAHDLPEDLTLVPVYRDTDAHPDEAVALVAEK